MSRTKTFVYLIIVIGSASLLSYNMARITVLNEATGLDQFKMFLYLVIMVVYSVLMILGDSDE